MTRQDYMRDYSRQYRLAHKTTITANNRKYVETHKDQVQDYQRKYRAENKTRLNAVQRAWTKTETGQRSRQQIKLKARFGINLETYEALLRQQNGQCLICKATKSFLGHKLVVDHDHRTGRIRGLLCKGCNLGLGNFNDSMDRLIAAQNYLRRNQL